MVDMGIEATKMFLTVYQDVGDMTNNTVNMFKRIVLFILKITADPRDIGVGSFAHTNGRESTNIGNFT